MPKPEQYSEISEDVVSHTIMRFLQKMGWNIIHYHSPGGQACNPISVGGELVYVDLIAVKGSSIVVFENKSKYDAGDIGKLRRMASSASALKQIRRVVESYSKLAEGVVSDSYLFCFAHGYASELERNALNDISLFKVSLSREVTVIEAVEQPMTKGS